MDLTSKQSKSKRKETLKMQIVNPNSAGIDVGDVKSQMAVDQWPSCNPRRDRISSFKQCR
jgi:hypothetical protein